MRVLVLVSVLLTVHSVCAVNYRKKIWQSLVPDADSEKHTDDENEKGYWNKKARDDIVQRITAHRENWSVAKNVIIFLGDGMGVSTLTAARIYKGQSEDITDPHAEGKKLVFEKFPHVGLSSTYNINTMTTDSSASGTAYMTGVKARQGIVSMDGHVSRGNISQCTATEHYTSSLHKWAVDSGKSAGTITTTRVTHATPAVTYAHLPDRNWESLSQLPEGAAEAGCVDIATQLIRQQPGKSFKVIMGGGRKGFIPQDEKDDDDIDEPDYHPGDMRSGSQYFSRGNASNLVEEWKADKETKSDKAKYVETLTELKDIPDDTEYLFGLFSDSHLPYQYQLDDGTFKDTPSLTQMTESAIRVLKNSHTGFVLMVEGGRIDHAHHENKANIAMEETLEMERAVQKAIDMTDEDNTLIVVTADHSHVFTINGYPNRGTPITGFDIKNATGDDDHQDRDMDDLVYSSVGYTNGPGFRYKVLEGGAIKRYDLEVSEEDPVNNGLNISDIEFTSESGVHTFMESHGGEDVAIYAKGPMSHLFHTNHEESYIAHVMGYAACVGMDEDHYDNEDCRTREYRDGRPSHAHTQYPTLTLITTALTLITTWRV